VVIQSAQTDNLPFTTLYFFYFFIFNTFCTLWGFPMLVFSPIFFGAVGSVTFGIICSAFFGFGIFYAPICYALWHKKYYPTHAAAMHHFIFIQLLSKSRIKR
jgi:hypothetical protein